jgi:hypothetical protein
MPSLDTFERLPASYSRELARRSTEIFVSAGFRSPVQILAKLEFRECLKQPNCDNAPCTECNLSNVLVGKRGRVPAASDLVKARMSPCSRAVGDGGILHGPCLYWSCRCHSCLAMCLLLSVSLFPSGMIPVYAHPQCPAKRKMQIQNWTTFISLVSCWLVTARVGRSRC